MDLEQASNHPAIGGQNVWSPNTFYRKIKSGKLWNKIHVLWQDKKNLNLG